MNHRFAWVAIFGLAVALAVGAVGYNIGVSHGLAMAASAAGAPGAAFAAKHFCAVPRGRTMPDA